MRVAVIGAGAAGLVTARELLREGLTPTVFEEAPEPGGVWVYDERVESDPLGRDPTRTRVHGSLYASLRTNLPRDLMAFSDHPFIDQGGGDARRFPGHAEVLRYLQSFVTRFELTPHLRLGARVEHLEPRHEGASWHAGMPPAPDAWHLRWHQGGQTHEDSFDAVAICNGHYREPRVPDLPGLDRFAGPLLHSHNYRHPESLAGLTVALLGAKSSGIDLAHELSPVARRVLLCARDLPRTDGGEPARNVDRRPPILAVEPNALLLQDGTREPAVDALILCTGYRYAFPFLAPAARLLDPIPDRVFPLYLDLLCAHAQTLAFVGLPLQVIPFPLFEHQARLWSRTLGGRVPLPHPPSQRLRLAHHREARFAAAGVPLRHRLRLGPAQFSYNANLAALAHDLPPPTWRPRLYGLVGAARRRDPVGYRDQLFPSASDLS